MSESVVLPSDSRLRAERRKKRILENSEDRLRKIAGDYYRHPKTENDGTTEKSEVEKKSLLDLSPSEWIETDSGICDVNATEIIDSFSPPQLNERHFAKTLAEPHAESHENRSGSGDFGPTSIPGANRGADGPKMATGGSFLDTMNSWMAKALACRLPLVILAIATHALLTSQMAFLISENAIVPFIAGEILLFASEKRSRRNSSNANGGAESDKNGGTGGSFLGAALILSGIRPERARVAMETAQTARRVAHDLAVYLFTFAAFHAIFS